jgi:hypothetical protein
LLLLKSSLVHACSCGNHWALQVLKLKRQDSQTLIIFCQKWFMQVVWSSILSLTALFHFVGKEEILTPVKGIVILYLLITMVVQLTVCHNYQRLSLFQLYKRLYSLFISQATVGYQCGCDVTELLQIWCSVFVRYWKKKGVQ